jgi:hypothetical protein
MPISRLKSGRKKTSHGGVKCSIPRKPVNWIARYLTGS